MLWVVQAFLVYEAVQRIQNPAHIDGPIMLTVAASGLVVNVIMGLILIRCGHGHSHGLQKCHGHDDDENNNVHSNFGTPKPKNKTLGESIVSLISSPSRERKNSAKK